MTKSIYLEKQTELILEQYAMDNDLTISKSINVLVQASSIEAPKDKVKPLKTSKKDLQPTKDSRPMSRAEMFRNFRA